MEICLITDEISADPVTAIELGTDWGVRSFELRGYYSERVPYLSAFQKDQLHETLEMYNARVVAISPGLFKLPLPASKWTPFPVACIEADLHRQWRSAQDLARAHLEETLPASIEFAKELGAEIITAFSFQRGGSLGGRTPDPVLEMLHQAADQTDAAGITLAVETEAGYWGDSGQNIAQLLEDVGHPALRVNWDPGNVFEAGDVPFPGGYQAVREKIAHVHFKDAFRGPDGEVQYVLEGEIDWQGQITALARDGYTGYISIETHMQPKVASAITALSRLRKLIGSGETA
jgi:sugar phosphate isomerase/epimerase